MDLSETMALNVILESAMYPVYISRTARAKALSRARIIRFIVIFVEYKIPL